MLKTAIYGVFTLMISVGGFIAAGNSQNPWPGFIIGFGIMIWFLWGLNQRWKKADEIKIRKRMFEEYMRSRHIYRQ